MTARQFKGGRRVPRDRVPPGASSWRFGYRRARQFRPRHQHLRPTILLPTQCHPNPAHVVGDKRIAQLRFRQRAVTGRVLRQWQSSLSFRLHRKRFHQQRSFTESALPFSRESPPAFLAKTPDELSCVHMPVRSSRSSHRNAPITVQQVEKNMTAVALGLRQIRSLSDGLYRKIFGKRTHRQRASQQDGNFIAKCLSCAPPADLLF
jgi:hypothetical protein